MRSGAFFFSVAKRNKTYSNLITPEHYLLVSTNAGLEIQAEFMLKTAVTSVEEISLIPRYRTEIIFDADTCSYNSIISQMERFKNDGVTFKIAYPKRGFMIGSNSSFDRGEILKFADNR
jgi:hypothetical protein